MDPDAFSACLIKWDPRTSSAVPPPSRLLTSTIAVPHPPPPHATIPLPGTSLCRPATTLGGMEDFFQAYGVRYYTVARMAELGFTVSTLLDMKDEEIDDMMTSLSQIFRWDLLVGERYGIKAAVRAERRRLDEESAASARRRYLLSSADATAFDALSQEGEIRDDGDELEERKVGERQLIDDIINEGLSEEPVQQEKEAAGSGSGGAAERKKQQLQRRRRACGVTGTSTSGGGEEEMDEYDEDNAERLGGCERQREHPFIVTEPGEVARGKKNGLDYLFHLYEQCREFLIQVQNLAKERGEKCPTKVTNQVFRYAKKAGASYINKPKMRHYVHCYALHCLDEEASNALRRAFKERGENVGAWRQACYKPLVAMAARQGWDIDAIFNAHPRLAIWYVPTKLRQLCHAERNSSAIPTSQPSF